MDRSLAETLALVAAALGFTAAFVVLAAHAIGQTGTVTTIAPQAPERSDHMEDLTWYERRL